MLYMNICTVLEASTLALSHLYHHGLFFFVAGSCESMDPAWFYPVGCNEIVDLNKPFCREIHSDHGSNIQIRPHVCLYGALMQDYYTGPPLFSQIIRVKGG